MSATRKARKSKPAPIRTALIEQLGALKKAYATDVESLLEVLFPRIHAGEFGRDLGEIGEVFEANDATMEVAPSTETMYALEGAIDDEIEFVDRASFEHLAAACSSYTDEAPAGDAANKAYWVLARDVRDAYLSRLARLSFRSTADGARS